MPPRIGRHERKCFICKDDIEDEIHLRYIMKNVEHSSNHTVKITRTLTNF